jgi:hypothetical protein
LSGSHREAAPGRGSGETARADEDDWARARAALDRVRPEPAERRVSRLRVQRRLDVLGVVLTAVAVLTLLVLLVVDRGSSAADPPTWRIVVGFAAQVIGLVLMVAAYVTHAGAVRHTRGWGRPMQWLTRREHKGLLRQVRGKDPLVPEQLPLARHAARLHLVQRSPSAAPSALLLLFVGQYVAVPGIVRFVLAAGMGAVLVAAEVHVRRDLRRIEQFLDAHREPRADG